MLREIRCEFDCDLCGKREFVIAAEGEPLPKAPGLWDFLDISNWRAIVCSSCAPTARKKLEQFLENTFPRRWNP